jgi:hypothetical protein
VPYETLGMWFLFVIRWNRPKFQRLPLSARRAGIDGIRQIPVIIKVFSLFIFITATLS